MCVRARGRHPAASPRRAAARVFCWRMMKLIVGHRESVTHFWQIASNQFAVLLIRVLWLRHRPTQTPLGRWPVAPTTRTRSYAHITIVSAHHAARWQHLQWVTVCANRQSWNRVSKRRKKWITCWENWASMGATSNSWENWVSMGATSNSWENWVSMGATSNRCSWNRGDGRISNRLHRNLAWLHFVDVVRGCP